MEDLIKDFEAKASICRNSWAGGSATRTGAAFERDTLLRAEYCRGVLRRSYLRVCFSAAPEEEFVLLVKAQLFQALGPWMQEGVAAAHGCKQPDECYLHRATRSLFIIEKKFQQRTGSVCEKIQSPDFKLWQYRRTFPHHQVHYLYCLSAWFRHHCPAEIEYLQYKRIPYFCADQPDYKKDIVAFMLRETAAGRGGAAATRSSGTE